MIKYLDSLWRKAVMKKYHNRSVYSSLPATEVHHIVTRSKKNTRWDIENGCPLTFSEHYNLHSTVVFRNLVYEKIGKEKIENLKRKSVQYFDKDFNRIKKTLIEALMKM
ncbi:MAG: hypothetical protein H8D22_10165 [Candidatus Cloacimonetes bacterium]|nr:hypothetical protein [Candidatus Cloacimonadota bacterium]